MKRKCLCSLLVMMCFYCTAFGQWVVSDPALTQLSQITWAKELKQAYEQFQVLGESRDILTKSLDLYRQVNGVIKNSKMVLQVLSMQGEMLELAAKECTRSDVFTGQEAYGEYTNVLNKIMEESVLSFDLIRTIISPSVSMTDGERIKIIVDLDNKLKENRDSVKIYFHKGRTEIDLSLRDNRRSLEKISRRILEYRPDTAFSICKIMVVGAASPEGSIELNRRLSELRAKRLFDHVCGYSPLPDTLKTSVFVGRDWRGLLRLVENDPGMPGKSETVELLQGIVSEVEASGNGENKINELKRLRYGIPYRYMYRNLFPDLRASCLYIWYESKRKSFPAMQVISHLHDTLYLPCKLSPFGGETGGFQSGEKHGPFYMAVKTNMLYDALLVPNIGVEFYVGKNWSLAGNWMYAWWKSDRHHNYWRLYGGDLEVRRWFGRKASEKPLAGHHIGLYGRIFTYDFETGGTGYMGGKPGGTLWDKMNYSVGLEYGYSLPVARRLNLDFVIGVGYWGGEYHKYAPIDGHYVWKETRRRHWFGLTEAEISLVWLLGRGNYNEKKGGRQ